MTPCILTHNVPFMLIASGDSIGTVVACIILFSPAFIVTAVVVGLLAFRKHQLSMQRAFIAPWP